MMRALQVLPCLLLLLLLPPGPSASAPPPSDQSACRLQPPPGSFEPKQDLSADDANLVEFALNLEYLEAELFLWASFGYGLDRIAPELAAGGPPPIGPQEAKLDPVTRDFVQQWGLQEVDHIRVIKSTLLNAFPRVQLNISTALFAQIFETAMGSKMSKPFDAYADSISFLLASYLVPYVGLTGYVGANPMLNTSTGKRLVAGLLAVESGQDAQIRALLYERKNETTPYGYTVADITDRLSKLRNELGHTLVVDEGLVVPLCLGAAGKTQGNALSGDKYSLGYARTPEQILGIVYGTGNPSVPGGFYPKGARGYYADKYLHKD